MIREILKMGDERLLRIAPPVPPEMFDSPELWQLIDDMFQTMEHVGGVGLGIANKILEPQIGAVLGKILILGLIILFIQKRPQGLFALKGRVID